MFKSLIAVSLGASAGAVLRWQLSLRFNAAGAALNAGTLMANALGGYLVGLFMAWLSLHPEFSPQWRLLLITGFCGGLTTFSTFSAEVMLLLQTGRLTDAVFSVAAHVLLSLVMTWAGLQTPVWLHLTPQT